MKTPYITTLILAAGFATPVLADGCLLPGEPATRDNTPASLTLAELREPGREGRLLYYLVSGYCRNVSQADAWERGMADERGPRREHMATWVAKARERAAEYRRLALARLESHPAEINDALYSHGSTDSVLFQAVAANDAELVRALLAHGAIPFLHEHEGWEWYGAPQGDLLLRGEATKPEILDMLRKARAEYNVLEIMLRAQAEGIELKPRYIQRPAK